MITEKLFLTGYTLCNRNVHSKFHVSSFSSFCSALICPFSLISPLQGMISENPSLAVTCIVLGFHIYSFSGLRSSFLCPFDRQRVFGISDLVKNPDGTAIHWCPWDIFRYFKVCSDAKESGVQKAMGSYRT